MYLTASRAALYSALAETVAHRARVRIAYDTPVQRIASDAGKAWVDGCDAPADLVVAADGVRSALAREAGGG